MEIKVKKNFKRKILVIIIGVIVLFGGGFTFLLYGPYSGFRDWLITTAMTTMSHQYLATWFYSDETINEVLNNNVVIESEDDTDTSLISVGEIDFNNYANAYEKQVLKKDADNDAYKLINIDGSGYNDKYGMLGSNKSTEERLKLFPRTGQKLVDGIQKKLKEKTGKTIEVMVYGDGAFRDPVGQIWELADPVVSPAYTSGLEGTPNEIKLKFVSDNKFPNLQGEELKNAIKEEIKKKDADLKGQMITQGTTPRRLTDLIGSLCDLTSGSGDKGTPVVFIQGYFDNLADE